jgi:hypothetical protein
VELARKQYLKFLKSISYPRSTSSLHGSDATPDATTNARTRCSTDTKCHARLCNYRSQSSLYPSYSSNSQLPGHTRDAENNTLVHGIPHAPPRVASLPHLPGDTSSGSAKQTAPPPKLVILASTTAPNQNAAVVL